MKRQSLLVATLGFIAPFAFAGSRATADKFPSRPIRAVVPWPAGGVVDVITRAVTAKASADWGSSIIVETKTGADGAIGTQYVARSAADGYTWLIGTLTTVTAPYVVKNIYSNPIDDFSGVAMLAASSLLAVVPATLPVKSVKEFVALARSRPGKLNYLNPGIGSASYLNCEILNAKEHINVVSVLYKGQPPGIPDLVSGRLQFALLAPQVAAPLVTAGKLKPLAAAFPKRIGQFPHVPTFAEAGFPEANVVASYYILVPKHTPRDVVMQISNEIDKAIADRSVRSRIEATGASVTAAMTPDQVDAFLKADTARWAQFFKEHKFSAE